MNWGSLGPRKLDLLAGGLLPALLFIVSSSDPAQVSPGRRSLQVLIVADEEFALLPEWERLAENVLERAAADFESQFGVVLTAGGFASADSDDSLTSLDLLAEDLEARARKGEHDIAVIFTGQENLDAGYHGYALFREAIVVIRSDRDRSRMVRALKHELAHLFGAVHVDADDSVMDLFGLGSRFDPGNAKIILLNKGRSFHGPAFPLPKESWEETASLAREIALSLRPLERSRPGPAGRSKRQDLEDVHLMLAQIYLEQADYEKVISECRTALRINPANLEGMNLWGVALRRTGRLDEAIGKYREILDRRPNHARVIYNLGIAHSKKGDLPAALEFYLKAAEIKPNFSEAHSNAGELYLRQGRLAEAEAAFGRAIEADAHFALAFGNLAEVFFRQNRLEEAEKMYLKAVDLDPALAKWWAGLGECSLLANRPEEAAGHLRAALERGLDTAAVHLNLSAAYIRTKEFAKAAEQARRGLELDPASSSGHNNLAVIYSHQGMIPEAVAEFEEALRIDPQNKEALSNLGSLYLGKTEYDRALTVCLKASDLDPYDAALHNNLAVIYFHKGDYDRSWEHAQKAEGLGLAPHPDLLKELKKKIRNHFLAAGWGVSWLYSTRSLSHQSGNFRGPRFRVALS